MVEKVVWYGMYGAVRTIISSGSKEVESIDSIVIGTSKQLFEKKINNEELNWKKKKVYKKKKEKCEKNTNTQLVYDFLIFCFSFFKIFEIKNALIATTVTELLTTVVQKTVNVRWRVTSKPFIRQTTSQLQKITNKN